MPIKRALEATNKEISKGECKSPTKVWPGQAPSSATACTKGKTRITVKYDVGFPNTLYLRGEGPSLSWHHGVKLRNVKPDEWVWETDQPFPAGEFKVLINDTTYEKGVNHKLIPGANVVYTPSF